MTPLIAVILAEIAKQTPRLVIDLVQVLSKPDATDADWDAIRARWSKSWAEKTAEAEARNP